MFYLDPMYFVFMLPAMALVMYAQWKVTSTFNKFSNVPTQRRMTGAQVAQEILRSERPRRRAGRTGSRPAQRPLRSAHEDTAAVRAGLRLDVSRGRRRCCSRSRGRDPARSVVRAAQAAQRDRSGCKHRQPGWPNHGHRRDPIGLTGLAWLGVIFFALGTVFALITLPVEFNASSRAMVQLTNLGIVDRTEYAQARKVLNAAALTYIAGFAAALLNLMYYVLLVTGMGRRNDLRDLLRRETRRAAGYRPAASS